MGVAPASAIFAIATSSPHPIDETLVRDLLQAARKGRFFAGQHTGGGRGTLAIGGLLSEGAGNLLLHGRCGRDLSEVEAIRAHLRGSVSGEFAFVAERSDELLGARDPLGAKPLYQGVASGLAVVSTEPSVIRSLSAEPEPVPPGYIVRLRGGCLRLAKYGCGLVAEPFRGSIDQAADEVGRLLKSSLMLRLKGVKSLGIAFSGGLDSSLLAVFLSKRHHVVLFSVFVEGSRDSSSAVRAADELGLELRTVKVKGKDVSRVLSEMDPRAASMSSMDRALSAGFHMASTSASELGLQTLVAGQGADEIFGGYHRHLELTSSRPWSLNALLMEELPRLEAGLRRDEAAIVRGGCEASFPYADFPLARLALSLPPDFLIAGGLRKIVLRRLAMNEGLPRPIVDAEKRAFQYSSGIGRLL